MQASSSWPFGARFLRSVLPLFFATLVIGCNHSGTSGVNTGTRLVPGIVTLENITTDDQVLYMSGANAPSNLNAIPIAGGQPKLIDSKNYSTSVWGRVVLSFGFAAETGRVIFTLTTWSSGVAAPSLVSSNVAPFGVASNDGTKIVFVDNVSPDGALGDLTLANVDGSNKQVLAAGTGAACQPQISVTATRALVARCQPPGAGGASTPATLTSYLLSTGTGTDISTTLQASASAALYSMDAAGDKLIWFDTAKRMWVANTDGSGTPRLLDVNVVDGYILADGTAAVYITAAGELKRVLTTGTPSPVALGPTTAVGFAPDHLGPRRSPDDKYVLWYHASADALPAGSAPLLWDMHLSATSTPGAATNLAPNPIGFIIGSAFTADSSRVLYFANSDPYAWVGTLNTATLSGASSPTSVSDKLGSQALALTGTKILYYDNATVLSDGVSEFWTNADLKVRDVNLNAAPKLIATQAQFQPALSAAKDKVVYYWDQVAGMEGLYVAPATP